MRPCLLIRPFIAMSEELSVGGIYLLISVSQIFSKSYTMSVLPQHAYNK
jgi:hypothetical protein